MSRIDLNKNREALLSAQKEICDVKKSNDCGHGKWALFGYEGQTSILKVVGSGDGGIEELLDELSSGKVMYAWLRVKDPNTGLPKFVLINWQGEAVPELRKGSSASHFNEVKNFFRGSHLTVHARTEDDVDEESILDKISKSSGSNYSFHKEQSKPMPEAGPVGSVYKRTLPQAEIKSTNRDAFWQKQQEEEKKRQEEDKLRKSAEMKKLDEDRKEREKAEASEREKREQERQKVIRGIQNAERKANEGDSTEANQKWEQTQREALHDEDERRKRSEMLRKERQAEAQKLVQQRGDNPRNMFEHKPASQFDEQPTSRGGPPPVRKLKHSFMPEDQNQQNAPRKGPIQLPTVDPNNPEVTESTPRSPQPTSPTSPTSPGRFQQPAAPLSPSKPSRPAAEPTFQQPPRAPEPTPAPAAPAPAAPAPAAPAPAAPAAAPPRQAPAAQNILAQTLPQRPPSDDEQEDEDNWEEDSEPSKPPAVLSPTVPDQGYPEEDIYQNDAQMAAQPTSPGGGADKGLCARALYDYQAADETEITFDPDDIITNIEQIDEGWWTGMAPDGHHGMFPANYVEMI